MFMLTSILIYLVFNNVIFRAKSVHSAWFITLVSESFVKSALYHLPGASLCNQKEFWSYNNYFNKSSYIARSI